jgi:LysM repeat protein
LNFETKKVLGCVCILGGASFAFFLPLLASASIFSSLLSGTAAKIDASGTSAPNSQTIALLAPAVNLDPNPSTGGGDITFVDGSALVPQEGPSGTAADIANGPTNRQISVYIVHDGDTLSGIAKMFDVTVNTILGANDIKDGVVHPGQTLVIFPIPGLEHTVLKGETLASLAKKYKSDAEDIAAYNGLDAGEALAVGASLFIPNGEEVVAPVSKPKSTTQTARSKAISNIASGKTTEPYLGGSGPALSGYFAWPLAGGIITQGLHGWNAVDIGAPKGTDIYAAAGGTVIIAKGNGGWNGGYGNYVVVQHSNGTETLYAHMSKVLTSPGAHVGQGDLIGKVGSTGQSTGSHLHFEVRGAANPFAN